MDQNGSVAKEMEAPKATGGENEPSERDQGKTKPLLQRASSDGTRSHRSEVERRKWGDYHASVLGLRGGLGRKVPYQFFLGRRETKRGR